MKKTENFALSQWEAHDPIRREDFNADNAAIDAALGVLSAATTGEKIVFGSYVGTGIDGRFLDLGCTPKLAILLGQLENGVMIAFVGTNFCYYVSGTGSSITGARIVEGGVTLKNNTANASGKTGHYILFL